MPEALAAYGVTDIVFPKLLLEEYVQTELQFIDGSMMAGSTGMMECPVQIMACLAIVLPTMVPPVYSIR